MVARLELLTFDDKNIIVASPRRSYKPSKLISLVFLPCSFFFLSPLHKRNDIRDDIITRPGDIDCSNRVGKKLERGISRATENVNLVSRARQEFEMDFHTQCHEQNEKNLNFIDTPDYTFTLPDLTKYTEEFRWVLHVLLETDSIRG